MEKKKIKDVPMGDFFVTSSKYLDPMTGEPNRSSDVFIRGNYHRVIHAFECIPFDDIDHPWYYDGEKEVITDFYFPAAYDDTI